MRDAREFAQLIPNARSVVYDDTGHLAMLERPARFNALVDEFLAEPRQRVTAPSEALETSLAYFWIATPTCSSARAGGS